MILSENISIKTKDKKKKLMVMKLKYNIINAKKNQ